LIPILEGFLPVKFSFSLLGGAKGEAIIITEEGEGVSGSVNDAEVTSSLRVPRHKEQPRNGKPSIFTVRFADDPEVPFPFRGRSLRANVGGEPRILLPGAGEKVLAWVEAGPIWTMSFGDGANHYRSAFPPPDIPQGGNLHDVLNAQRFLELLPVIHFVRNICSPGLYEEPPLRACFMFDDPNLHWPRYGFVDFKQIAAHATRENYHVSFATIPLDAWFTHDATVQIFRMNPGRLSLLVHGNDHTKEELGQKYTKRECVSLLGQAVQRVERLERTTGLQVSRIMVPPHGACSEEMLEELPRCGFEAACISHGSLRAHNRIKPWTKNLGFLPSEMVEDCPVLPRWGLNGNTENTILLAAYLGQPIILRGHHSDLKSGVELLDQLAQFINGLGSVLWADMTNLSRVNYLRQQDGNLLRLKPLGRKLNVQLPKGATQFVVENPFHHVWESWQISGADGVVLKASVGEPVTLSEGFGRTISMETAAAPLVPSENHANRPAMLAFLRRLLTEGRDRFHAGW
jgi:hypothetical protein